MANQKAQFVAFVALVERLKTQIYHRFQQLDSIGHSLQGKFFFKENNDKTDHVAPCVCV